MLVFMSVAESQSSTCILVSGSYAFSTKRNASWKRAARSNGNLNICGLAMSTGLRIYSGTGASHDNVSWVFHFLHGPAAHVEKCYWQHWLNYLLTHEPHHLNKYAHVVQLNLSLSQMLWTRGRHHHVPHCFLLTGLMIPTGLNNISLPVCDRRRMISFVRGPFIASSSRFIIRTISPGSR